MGDVAPVLGLIDLDTGAVVELTENAYATSIGWSPDSRFAFFIAGGDGYGGISDGVRAYDRQSGEVFPVLSEPLNWNVLAVRPAPS